LESFEENKIFEDAACAVRQCLVVGSSITHASSGRIFHFRISQSRMDRARIQTGTAAGAGISHHLLRENRNADNQS
jgi:hypothetical protein